MNNHKVLITVLAIIVVAGALLIVRRADAPYNGVPNIPDTQTGGMDDEGSTAVPVQITTKIDQGASALGVKIVPLAILEDSRCPADVVCIQAGTVRVRALVVYAGGESEQMFVLGQRVPVGEELDADAYGEVTLVDVKPYPYAGKPTAPADYKFTWEVRTP